MHQNRLIHAKVTTWGLDIFFLCVFLGLLFFFLLGDRPLFVPDEGRYAEITREMITKQDYVTPYLNDIKYFEKPILFYWLSTLACKLGGMNLWSIRSVNAILGLIGCLATYLTIRKLYDRTTGFLSAILLGTSCLYCVMAHMISLDLPVSVFITLCLYAFLLGTREINTTERVDKKICAYFCIAALMAALAVLTKGLIGLVFPLSIIGLWLIIIKKRDLCKSSSLFFPLLVFLLIALPWHVLVQYRNHEFFYFYFIEQHFLRYATPKIGHYQPAWFFLPCLILGFFPWTVFLPQAMIAALKTVRQDIKKASNEIFFLIWFIFIFIFFSFSNSKLIPYILPAFPPIAILTARYLSLKLTQQKYLGLQIGATFLLIFSIIIFIKFYQFSHHTLLPNPQKAKLLLILSSAILMTLNTVSFFYAFINPQRMINLIIPSTWIFLILLMAAVPSIDSRSILPLAIYLKSHLKPGNDVITYNQYFQDLPFYLQRRISILNWRNELTFGMKYQDTKTWMIDDATFWQRYKRAQPIFVLIDWDEFTKLKKAYPTENFYLLKETLNTALISNVPSR